MTKALINNFEYIMKVRVRIIWTLGAIAVCFVASYLYFMEKAVVNSLALTSTQTTMSHESQTVSDLSSQYVALRRNITLDSALSEGFKEASVVAFISVPVLSSKSPALSINSGLNTY